MSINILSLTISLFWMHGLALIEYNCDSVDCNKLFIFPETSQEVEITCVNAGNCDTLIVYSSVTLHIQCIGQNSCNGIELYCGNFDPPGDTYTPTDMDKAGISCYIECSSATSPGCNNVLFSCQGSGVDVCQIEANYHSNANVQSSTLECNIDAAACDFVCYDSDCIGNNYLLCHDSPGTCQCYGVCGDVTKLQSVTYSPTTAIPTTSQPTNTPQLYCPLGSAEIGTRISNNDIDGCGLEDCENRYDKLTVGDCYNNCISNPQCTAFSFAPIGGEQNHLADSVCTIYDSSVPISDWGPNQIFCVMNTPSPTTNAPTTTLPTTRIPTTNIPTTVIPTTNIPTTSIPTTSIPTTTIPTTNIPTTIIPTTTNPTMSPTTNIPTTNNPTTQIPTTSNPTTVKPTETDLVIIQPPNASPTNNPTTYAIFKTETSMNDITNNNNNDDKKGEAGFIGTMTSDNDVRILIIVIAILILLCMFILIMVHKIRKKKKIVDIKKNDSELMTNTQKSIEFVGVGSNVNRLNSTSATPNELDAMAIHSYTTNDNDNNVTAQVMTQQIMCNDDNESMYHVKDMNGKNDNIITKETEGDSSSKSNDYDNDNLEDMYNSSHVTKGMSSLRMTPGNK